MQTNRRSPSSDRISSHSRRKFIPVETLKTSLRAGLEL
jgi:hypothetical protein